MARMGHWELDARIEIKVPAHNDILRGVPTVHGQGEVIHDFDLVLPLCNAPLPGRS